MIRIAVRPSGRKHVLHIYDDEALLHTDTIDLHRDQDRKRLLKRVGEQNGVNRDELELRLGEAVEAIIFEEETSSLSDAVPIESHYLIDDGRMILAGDPPTVLANFSAQIVEERIADDGIDQSRQLVVSGELQNGTALPDVTLSPAEFSEMDWVVGSWGTGAIVYAGRAIRDHLRVAIQRHSEDVRRVQVFKRTGWFESDGEWGYLHAGGAIGVNGLRPEVITNLPQALSLYLLPQPPTGTDLTNAVRASLRLLDVAADQISVPLLATVFAPVVGETDFSIHMVGRSGGFKSSLAALAQQHFGRGMDATHLPASWSSTANSLEGLAFYAKDALLVLDDYVLTGTAFQIQSANRDADRLLRAQGNRSGRQRMDRLGNVRPPKPPRGIILSTGEEIPKGQSLGARMLVVEVNLGDVHRELLTAAQRDGSNGLYAECLAGFLQWMAAQYSDILRRLALESADLRESFQQIGLHPRTPGIAAILYRGLDYFLQFAQSCGAISTDGASTVRSRCRVALQHILSQQIRKQSEADPIRQFFSRVQSALRTAAAHLYPVGRQPPPNPLFWGWVPNPASASGYAPSGPRIGWIRGDDVYLDPEAAFIHAQQMARGQGDVLAINLLTLEKRLFERNLLVTEGSQSTLRHRLPSPLRAIRGLRLRPGVLALDTDDVPNEGDSPGPEVTQEVP